MADPQPTSELSEDLGRVVTMSRRVIWGVMIGQGVLIFVLVIVVGILAWRQLTERERTLQIITSFESAQCGFYYPVASAVPDSKSGKIGTQLIENSRIIVRHLDCPEKLPPPSPALIRLGAKYHIKITR